jgi:hypothetical protein
MNVNKVRLVITVVGSAIGMVAAGAQARKAVQKNDKLSLVNALASVLVAVTGGALAIRGARKDGDA